MVIRTAPIMLALLLLATSACVADGPRDNPVAAHYRQTPDAVPEWVNELPWKRVVSIATVPGEDDDARFAAAQQKLLKQGGGVLYFPAGVYRFKQDLHIRGGIILRGADPREVTDAKDEHYDPPTRFEFPRYRYSSKGEGTPIDTAFKAIRLDTDVAGAGVVNIAINRGRIDFAEAENHKTAPRRLVFGCRLTNAAAADPTIPDKRYGNKPHQRWTARHWAAIDVYGGSDVFVANNRIPQSGDDNFVIPNFTLLRPSRSSQGFRLGQPHEVVTIEDGVLFDYDNRPGIYVNGFGMPDATPDTHPWGFRKGSIIRDNYVYCTGRSAIHFTGDGVICSFNVIRFPAGVWRPTTDGKRTTDGSSTNDNRALTMRGWRWVAEGNDYIVHSNIPYRSTAYINDGEGIMHEHFANSTIKDSRIINNRGNRYLCIWDADVDGLLIEGNTVSDGGDPAIHILGRNRTVRNVRIVNNRVTRGAIQVTAQTYGNILVEGNTWIGEGRGQIRVGQSDWVKDNAGFDVVIRKPKR